MPDPAEEQVDFLDAATWCLIGARLNIAHWRMDRDLARLTKPTPGKLARIYIRFAQEWLGAYAIPALTKICHPTHWASFIQTMDERKSSLLDGLRPLLAKLIQDVSSPEAAAHFASQFGQSVNAEVSWWKSQASLKLYEYIQEQRAGNPNSWISRLSQPPSSETGEYPVNGDIRRADVPDSAIEGNNPADPKAKAVENENSRHSHERRHSSLEPAEYRPGRMPVSVGSSDAVRKMDEYIGERKMTLTQFAGLVPTSDRTLRNFRRTGKVRRDIFGRIATLIRVTPGALAKED